jgi:hypothetical protein
MKKKRDISPSEHAQRAMAGVSQGVRSSALPGMAGLGLLAIAPYSRKLVNDTSHVPAAFKTDTPAKLEKLVNKLVSAGGRNPEGKKRPFEIWLSKDQFAQVSSEYGKQKGRKARDVLYAKLKATPESLGHEIGHITHKAPLEKLLYRTSLYSRTPLGLAVPTLLAATGLLAKPGEEAPITAKAAPYVGGAQLAAIVGDEVRASMRGTKLLKAIGYNSSLRQRIGRQLMALPYLGHAAGLIAAPIGILKGIEWYDKARKKGVKITPIDLVARSPESMAKTLTPTELKKKWEKKLQT